MAEEDPNGGAPGTQGGPYEGPRATDFTPEPDHSDDPGYITRTRFLSTVAIAGGGILTAAILVPVVGFAVANPLKSEQWRWVDIGPASDFLKNAPPYANATPSTKIGEVTSLAVAGTDPEADRRIYLMFGLVDPSAKPIPGPDESTDGTRASRRGPRASRPPIWIRWPSGTAARTWVARWRTQPVHRVLSARVTAVPMTRAASSPVARRPVRSTAST